MLPRKERINNKRKTKQKKNQVASGQLLRNKTKKGRKKASARINKTDDTYTYLECNKWQFQTIFRLLLVYNMKRKHVSFPIKQKM